MPTVETRNEKLDLRLTPSAKRTLQIAAQVAQRSVSEFVLESALARAEETLPDRQKFGLDAETASRLDGQMVSLKGTLIYRGNQTMIEVADGSIKPIDTFTLPGSNAPTLPVSLGQQRP